VIPRDHPLAGRALDLIPINSLEPRLQDEVLQQSELLEFKKKKTVFEEGARDAFTFYLLDGELELHSKGASPIVVRAGEDNARRALAQLQPRRYTARSVSVISVLRIQRAVLDHILSDEQVVPGGGSVEVEDVGDEEDGDWMTRLISSELFTRLPPDNIQRFFAELEAVECEAGEVVVEQGTQGEYLYIVAEGKCAVTRRPPGSSQELQLAMLREGDTFGEESLISNTPRNASVKMQAAGFVMRLPKRSFEELVSKPTLKALPWSEACKAVEAGAAWLDVRFPDEHAAVATEGGLNVPLNTLRLELPKLDKSRPYVVYCDTGARSSTGAFLLARAGFDVSYLAGGLQRTPLGEKLIAAPAAAAPPPKDDAADDDFSLVRPPDAPAKSEPAPAPTGKPAGTAAPAKPAPGATAPAKPPPAPPRPAAPSGKSKDELAAMRAQLAKLKGERDKATVYAKRASEAAKELKRRYQEQSNVAQAEREKREAAEKQVAAAKADAERQSGMERSRLQGELDKATGKLEQLQSERATLAKKLEAAVKEARGARAKVEQAESVRVSQELAFEESVQSVRDELAAEKSRAEKAEQERAALEQALAKARESVDALESSQEIQRADLERAVQEAGADRSAEWEKLEADRATLEKARAELETERSKLEADRRDAEAKLKQERETLERETATLRERFEALDEREIALGDERASMEAEVEQREAAVASAEAALSKEKSEWAAQVEKAIADERARLEEEFARYKQSAREAVRKAARELADQEAAKLRTELEAEAAEARAGGDAEIAALREQLAELRDEYETRLSEQEALLEDERRRLETENARLREALAAARRAPVEPAAAPAAAAAVAPAVDTAAPAPPAKPVSEKQARVVSASQLADIRRKMEEKMKGSKAQPG